MATGAAAGLLTASGLVVGFAPELGTHAVDRPPTPSEDPSRTRTDDGTTSRSAPRTAPSGIPILP